MGRAEDPHVDLDLTIATHPAEAAVVEEAQQFGLQVRRHLADLVEKYRALVGQLQQPRLAAPLRAGEGAGGVAEQLAFGQALRQCRAVQRQERRAAPGTDGVAGTGHQFFAGAGFALDQQRRIEGCATRWARALRVRIAGDSPSSASKPSAWSWCSAERRSPMRFG